MNKSISEMAIAVMVLVALAAFAMPASASGDPGAGCDCDTELYGTMNGSVYLEQQGWMSYSPMTKTFDVPSGIKEARIYSGVWQGSPGKGGYFNMTVENSVIDPFTTDTYKACDPCPTETGCSCCQAERCDMLNNSTNMDHNAGLDLVNMHGYTVGCGVQFYSFNATPYIKPGANTITVETETCPDCARGGWDGRIYLIALMVVYEDSSMTETTYWVNEGALYLEKGSDCDGPDDHLYASKYFNGTHVADPTRVKLWSMGWPHVINADTTLNGNPIGSPDIDEGDYLLRWNNIPIGYLDATSNFLEYNDPNPGYERAFVEVLLVEHATLPDITVTDIEFPAVMRPDMGYTITATVENQGNLSTGAFDVRLDIDGSPGTPVNVGGLGAGASTTVNFLVNLAEGCHEFKVVSDCNGAVDEGNENNNAMTEDYQAGYYIVVTSNSDFGALVDEGLARLDGGTYYIDDLDLENCAGRGISIEHTSVPFVISNCTVHDCLECGIFCRDLTNGEITGSTVESNHLKGIKLQNCSYVVVDNNIVQDNDKYGIDVYMENMPYLDSHHIAISNNLIARNLNGIELMGFDCTVNDNTILNSTAASEGSQGWGIYVSGNYSEIYNNTIKHSDNHGIYLANSLAIPTYWNRIYGNDFVGNNQVISNPSQANDTGTNYWNTATPVAYSYGGTTYTNFTGNYWSDYTGSDPDGDGIGNTAHPLDGGTGAEDSYPMILPWWGDTFDIPIYNGKNLIAIPLIQDDPTLAAVFGDDPVNLDKVCRYVPGVGYKTATYWSGGWVGFVSDVEPIEPEVGYEYEREGADYTLTVHGTRCTGTISTPIYNGKNLIGYVNFTETDLSTFNSPVDLDKVCRYVPGVGYKTATYWSGGWVGFVSDVEPIEPGVGYEYERAGVQYDWIYEA